MKPLLILPCLLLLLCAKNKAVPAALAAYRDKCIELGANPEHINSVGLLLDRVEHYQQTIESRIPDTVGSELPRCLEGILPELSSGTPG